MNTLNHVCPFACVILTSTLAAFMTRNNRDRFAALTNFSRMPTHYTHVKAFKASSLRFSVETLLGPHERARGITSKLQ